MRAAPGTLHAMQARVFIRDDRERIRRGHPWVFASQVMRTEGHAAPGDIVQVVDVRQGPLGQGYHNQSSQIRVRMLTTDPGERIDAGFFHGRLQRAWDLRQRLGRTAHCRVVFGEADGLPALVVDKFGGVLVLQTLALGIDRWKDDIVRSLRELIAPEGIYERNDVPVRGKEGLPMQRGPVGEAFDTRLVVEEYGLHFEVDVATGQKTGHFLDQVDNHAAMALVARGQRVLDCFTHTGGFALHAAHHGASEVTGIDISADAVLQAARNAERNGLHQRCRFQEGNVFDHLVEAAREGRTWDVVVLDPPAFAKSRAAMDKAWRGYKEINLRAMKCLPPGGFLVTSSCSQHMTPELFRRMVEEAARDAGRRLVQIHAGGQPPDHPVHWSIPETEYLKCLYLQVW
jgi:23S rRNA (cytosine1962-C5)-methyltransferase